MSAFRDIMSIVDPSVTRTAPAPKPVAPTSGPRPSRPVGGTDSTPQTSQLKRKASGVIEGNQVKIQRKESIGPPLAADSSTRSSPTSATAKSTPHTPAAAVPYRGTAAPASARPSSPVVKKPVITNASSAPPKAAPPAPKTTTTAPGLPVTSTAAPKKGYLALLQKAKEKDSTKPPALPGKQEPAKILSRKERLALKAEASANKGKKPIVGVPLKSSDSKADALKEKRKAVEVGYQGTARPTKKAADVGYSGTARPANAPSSLNRGGTAAKAKSNPMKGRYDGYADWDDLSDADENEEDYESDMSSDMEGGLWDVEEEEDMALKVAKKEDAEALAEETALKRAKEERKRKLLAMSKVAAAKRKY